MNAMNGLPCTASGGSPRLEPYLPADPTFSNVFVKLSDKITDSATAQNKDKLISDLINKIRNNRQLLNEHNFVLFELQNREPLVANEEICNSRGEFGHTYAVSEKVDKMIAFNTMKNVLNLNPTVKSTKTINIFGFTDIPSSSINISGATVEPNVLNFEDASELRTSLEKGLTRKCNDIIQKYNERQEVSLNVPVPTSTSCPSVSGLTQLGEIQVDVTEINALLLKESSLYENIVDLRVQTGDAVERLLACLKQQIKAAAMKTKAVDMKMNANIYLENEHVWEAVTKLHCNLEEEIITSKTQLQKLLRDEELHNEMAGNVAYNKILIEYKELQKLIRQKKIILRRF